MRAFLSVFLLLVSIPARADLCASWTLDLRSEGGNEVEKTVVHTALLDEADGVSDITSGIMLIQGELRRGTIMMSAKRISKADATLQVSVFDRTGLSENSPFFKNRFIVSLPLSVGETSEIFFSLGDTSVKGASEYKVARFRLDSVVECFH